MGIQVEIVPFRGWPNALRVGNGTVELIVTLDVGPRILSYSRVGGLNPLSIFEDHAGGAGEKQWRNRGGHRLWLAPESQEFSYFPDNSPVAWSRIGGTGVRLTPPAESGPGFQKEIELILEPGSTRVAVTHRIRRTGATPCLVAPWALTVLAAGGRAILPQPAFGEHPRDLLPNRRMVVWPYTDIADPRYRFGRRYYTLRQQPGGTATKIGLRHGVGWAGYLLAGTLFVKRFGLQESATYPDDGCNLEVFTNARMLELESLGPLVTLASGEASELLETWELHDGLAGADPEREEEFAAALARLGLT